MRSGLFGQLVSRLVHGGAYGGLVAAGRAETTVTRPVDAVAWTEVTPWIPEISPDTAPSQWPQVIPVTW